MSGRVVSLIAALLFVSGACSLIYQIAWLREFRLVFGASTAASAAVIAIFMGGLGVGGLLIGRRIDSQPRPLAYYARLELIIAASTALTPLLLWLVRAAYIGVGGKMALGAVAGTAVQLLLACLVMAVPTIVMGGTLPAATKVLVSKDDDHRARVGLVYGINTLGAVCGCLLATFVLLEALGIRWTLWSACVLNLVLSATAFAIARRLAPRRIPPPAPRAVGTKADSRLWFILGAAATVGFVFFLMELVWYRMLGPILGGTVFTFGLILAVALLGIGVGGVIYAVFLGRRRATLTKFGYTCVLEAVLIAIPFALGDDIARMALELRSLGSSGFIGFVAGWSVVTAVVVFLPAVVAGVQFPLLIALLSQTRPVPLPVPSRAGSV